MSTSIRIHSLRKCSSWLWKLSQLLLLNENVMNISRLLTFLWFIPWGNWVPDILIQWSSLLSPSDLFLCALPWSGICSTGYKIVFSSAPMQILSALLKCLDSGSFISTDIWYVINHSIYQTMACFANILISTSFIFNDIYDVFLKQFNPTNIVKSKSSLQKRDFSSK